MIHATCATCATIIRGVSYDDSVHRAITWVYVPYKYWKVCTIYLLYIYYVVPTRTYYIGRYLLSVRELQRKVRYCWPFSETAREGDRGEIAYNGSCIFNKFQKKKR